MKRTLILIGVLALITGLAFLVARPSREPPAATPYVGVRGASRAKASGLALTLWRGEESSALVPGTPVRAGDVLRFAVRAERPRFLIVRLREGRAPATTIFPAGASEAALVQPRETLPIAPTLGADVGKVVVTALFADHAFSLEGARAAGAEEIDVVIEKEPTP